jgi:hypothetical protein
VYVVIWDVYGYGHDTLFGVYWDEFVALQDISLKIAENPIRYTRQDFLIKESEIN